MRNTFINTLSELAQENPNIFLLCGDLGYSVLEPFAKAFPDRFLNVGIAEQNMTGVAVGLAREGYNVFTYSIGNFPTLRCMEQIRYDVCYHRANVKIIAVGAGYAYGPQGVSHHTTEDIGMLRTIPNMTICAPADPIEAKLAANFMSSFNGPGYVRINKSGEAIIHGDSSKLRFSPGEFIQVSQGKNVVVITTGAILGAVLDEIKSKNYSWSVFSSPFIGSYNKEKLIEISKCYENIVTVEEHQLNGGFGSSIVEIYSDLYDAGRIKKMPHIRRIGINNKFIGVAGTQDYLRSVGGLDLAEKFLEINSNA